VVKGKSGGVGYTVQHGWGGEKNNERMGVNESDGMRKANAIGGETLTRGKKDLKGREHGGSDQRIGVGSQLLRGGGTWKALILRKL